MMESSSGEQKEQHFLGKYARMGQNLSEREKDCENQEKEYTDSS